MGKVISFCAKTFKIITEKQNVWPITRLKRKVNCGAYANWLGVESP